MGFLSFVTVALLFVSLTAGQGTPTALPAITGPSAAASSACGGCYVVADVAGIYFGSETLTQTHTVLTSIGITPNGTNVTSTSLIVASALFTIFPTGLEPGGVVSANYGGPTITIGGVALTSPTAYDVFTAYSVTSTVLVDGTCVVSQGTPTTLPTALSFLRPSGAGAAFDMSAEEMFISAIGGLPTCSPGGINGGTTGVVPVANITSSITTSGFFTPPLSPQPIVTPTLTTVTATISSTSVTTVTATVSSTSTTTLTLESVTPLPSILPIASALSLPTGTTTITSIISTGTIVIVSNSTFLQTGVGPSLTIIPFNPGKSDANGRTDRIAPWLLWGTGALSTMLATWAL